LKFDFDTPIDRAGTWSTRWDRYAGRDVIPLWVADTDFRPPPAVLDALSARIAHGILGYTTVPDALRQAIVERLEQLYRWRIRPDWIVFLPGVVPGLHHAARTLTQSGEHIVLPTPVYQHLKRAAELAPRPHTTFPLVLERGRWVFDLGAMRSAVSPKTRLLFLCNPQNPGGTVFTREELSGLAEAARDLVIVSDEIHCDLVLDAHLRHVPIASLAPEISRRTVTLMSPNKSFNFPAAGCAWAIIEDPALRRTFEADVQGHAMASPSVFGYAAALAAYREGDAWLAAQIEYLRANRDLVERTVSTWGSASMAHLEATYLAWIDCSGMKLQDPVAHFLRHGVGLSPGAQFGADAFVRLNFGTQRSILEKALARMTTAVESVSA
jgi:cystathionine beta-lyase